MILLCSFLAGSTLLLAVCLVYTAKYFLQREAMLVDRLLKQGGIAPVVIEREKVVKLPDPEIQPMTWQDEAFFTDDIKEELEQVYPEAARMSHGQAKERYVHDWQTIEKRLREQRTPLRAG
jgi:hypothetical protein